jgi:hypothetical protein
MFVAILILVILPLLDISNIKGSSYRPIYTIAFWIFCLNFLVLMWLGSCHVEPPYIVAGQIATIYYFLHYLIIVPILGIIDNVLSLLGTSWISVPLKKVDDYNNRKDWMVLYPSDPAKMSKEEKAIWDKIKADIIKQDIIISPGMVGGSLVA